MFSICSRTLLFTCAMDDFSLVLDGHLWNSTMEKYLNHSMEISRDAVARSSTGIFNLTTIIYSFISPYHCCFVYRLSIFKKFL